VVVVVVVVVVGGGGGGEGGKEGIIRLGLIQYHNCFLLFKVIKNVRHMDVRVLVRYLNLSPK